MGDTINASSGIELDLIELPDIPELNDDEDPSENRRVLPDQRDASGEQGSYGHTDIPTILDDLDKKMTSGQVLHTFTAQIEEINRIIKMKYSSSKDIASVILKDVALSSRVLSIVNSCYYGQFAQKGISSISDAMVILGTEEVQQAAATLLLFEFMRDLSKSEMLKDKSLASLMRGIMAKQIAEGAKYSSSDEFQIAAMLYDIGEQVMLFFEPEIYQKVILISEQKGIEKDAVAKKVIGASFAQIGQKMVSRWGFPQSVVDSIGPFEEFEIDPKKLTAQSLRRLVASFTNEMCNIDWRINQSFRHQKLEEIVNRYGRLLGMGLSGADELLTSAIQKVEKQANILKVNLKNSRFDRKSQGTLPVSESEESSSLQIRPLDSFRRASTAQVESDAAVEISLMDADSQAEIVGAAGQVLSRESSASSQSEITPDIQVEKIEQTSEGRVRWIEEQIHKIETALTSGFRLSEILQLIIITIYKGFFFSRISICIMNKANGMMAARLVLGDESERFGREFKFLVSDSDDLFNKSLSTGLDIVVEDLRGRGVNSRIPDWYVKGGFASSFALYPVVVERKKVGLIYVDWESSQSHLFSDQVKQLMKRLKNLTVTAIKKSRT